MSVIDEIAAERQRQIDQEGFTNNVDDTRIHGEIAECAACYLLTNITAMINGIRAHRFVQFLWPFDLKMWKPKDKRKDLIRAAALIVAEIERLDRMSQVRDD